MSAPSLEKSIFPKSLAVTYKPLTELKPDSKNSRIHSKKQLQQLSESIKTFGFLNPVLLDSNNKIICGHGRVMAAELLKIDSVPTISIDHLNESQKKAFLIADNKLTENASWNRQLLAQNFLELSHLDLDFCLTVTGFETGEIDLMIQELSFPENAEQDSADPIPEVKENIVVSQLGDLWVLGSHRLYCGSALERESFAKLMEGHKANMVFTDPPYNVKINGHVSGSGETQHREFIMASGEMSPQEFTKFLETSFKHLKIFSTDGSIHYVCMDFRHMFELLKAGINVYEELKNLCVWVKNNGGMGSFYRGRHELIFVFKSGTASHKNNFELGQNGRYRTNVWEYAGMNSFSRHENGENLLEIHPTVKPVAMISDAILDCSDRGDIILDSFSGSGTTIIAAEKTGRKCFALELDPIYVDVAIRRWQKLTGKAAIQAHTGEKFDELYSALERNHASGG